MEQCFSQNNGARVHQDDVNGWVINWTNQVITFPKWALIQSFSRLEHWLQVCSDIEETWVQKNFDVPTLWLKFDCVVAEEEQHLGIYEIDDCPDGLGVSSLINSFFRERLAKLRTHWPHFKSVTTDGRVTDDNLWLGQPLALETMNGYKGLVVTRAKNPGDLRLSTFVNRSVSTCLTQSAKHYGVPLGLWQESNHHDDLPWKTSFVLKASHGYGSKGIHIRHKGRFAGVSGKGGIISAHQSNGVMYHQPFIMPMVCPFDPNFLMVLRPFFGFNPATGKYEYLGGFWLARAGTLKLHGAADAVVGPLI